MEVTLFGLADRYVEAGFSVIPIRGDGSKAPALPWSEYQRRAPTVDELNDWFHPERGAHRDGGLGLVCGQASAGFEVLDFDVAGAFDEFEALLTQRGLAELLGRVSLTHTPRPGVHLGLRSPAPGRNQVLARRPQGLPPDAGTLVTLCETRGQGGYVLAPGCPGRCHPTGNPYRPFAARGVPLDQLCPLSPAERELLLETARLLAPQRTELGNPPDGLVVSPHRGGARPGDLFNRDGPAWEELLQPAGWVRLRTDEHGIVHWMRPGKRRPGTSATVSSHYSSHGQEFFYVFSTRAAPFQAGTAYSKFAARALLYHGGDFAAAARALVQGRDRPERCRPLPSLPPSGPPAVPASPLTPPSGPPPSVNVAPLPGRGGTRVEVIPMSKVRLAATAWLWRPWLPAGTLTVLDGDPGLGKSTLTLDLAARVTRGLPMPFEEPGSAEPEQAGRVLVLSAEDDPARTILPRLQAAGADRERVHLVGTVRDNLGERLPQLPDDLAGILEELGEVQLVIVDPLMAYLGEQFDACRDQNVRRCLFALSRLAERHQTTILLVRHLNKSGTGAAIYRGSGSIGILGAARACLLAGKDPEQEGQFVLAMSKCNLAATPRSLAYALTAVASGVAKVEWRGEVPWTANDLVGKPAAQSRQTLVEECAAWLRVVLGGGPLASAELQQRCAARGWTKATYERARQLARVQSRKEGFGAGWVSFLPDDQPRLFPSGDQP